jgi:ribosomal RNA-processing protein 8
MGKQNKGSKKGGDSSAAKSKGKKQQLGKIINHSSNLFCNANDYGKTKHSSGSSSNSKSKNSAASGASSNSNSNKSGLSALQQSFAKKLEGARFRIINEKLYTSKGEDAFHAFQEDPTQFEVYHQGFREQCAYWPYNPLDGIINWIKKGSKTAVIADMGCGDARLAASVPNTVHSFDLVSLNSRVVACDIANVPLKNNSVDVVVYCLALMGTNIADFTREAHRILKVGGVIKIAEVRSRFDGEGISIKKFYRFLKRAGFDLKEHDTLELNKMFFEVEGVKSDRQSIIAQDFTAKPCVYKKR